MRVSAPWIDALKGQNKPAAEEPSDTYTQHDMKARKMSDSTIFMDLDAMSGIIAYKHTGEGVVIVTAAVDRITIENPLTELCDLEYSGQVTYATGRSSMEVTCKVTRAGYPGEEAKQQDTLLTCCFSMVALDPKTRRSTPVPALDLQTVEEQATFKLGESRSLARKAEGAQSLLSHHPNEAESALIHRLWLQHRDAQGFQLHGAQTENSADSIVPMAATRLQNALICQPQYRNRHQWQIFGGFLLKQTFELAFCCAANFSHARPTFVSADPCTFLNPVPVGSVLYLTARIVFTESVSSDDQEDESHARSASESFSGITRLQVRVDSRVRNVEHGTSKPTGRFHYTFTVPRKLVVMPSTYQEFMYYIDARRRAHRVQNSMDITNVDKMANTKENSATE
ncbi:MAG: hypothetical protein M1828_007115 [Chrysothrix sp. TS-e1954]|nr:MAG: hypothetical protein M1828_007115 [Chrysothrix sp. TS-e1954]